MVEILSKISQNQAQQSSDSSLIDASKVLSVATSVKAEQDEVQQLKSVLWTQGTLRPIFENQLKQKRAVREHAIGLRKLVAEAGLNYQDLQDLYDNSTSEESRKDSIAGKIHEASDKDVDELVKLLDAHFIKNQDQVAGEANGKSAEEEAENKPAN